MKKLTFVVAALLAAATSFAQTTNSQISKETKATATHGQTVSTAAKTTVSGDLNADASGKGDYVSDVAKASKATAKEQKEAAKARKEEVKTQKKELQEAAAQKQAEVDVTTQTSIEKARQQKETQGQKVSTIAQETTEAGKEKGQLVKETATEKRKASAGRADTQVNGSVKAKTSAARQARVTTGLSVKPLKPVKVKTGANLKIGGK